MFDVHLNCTNQHNDLSPKACRKIVRNCVWPRFSKRGSPSAAAAAAAAAAAFVVAVWAVRAKPSVTAPCVDPLGRNAFILR